MSELRNGPFSGFTGRTGQLVGYRKNGKWIMAALTAVTPGPPTEAQKDQRLRFGIFPSWLSWIADFVTLGFQAYDKKMSAMNAAVKYNMDNALTGVAPNFAIDYSKVLLSRGRLAPANNLSVVSSTAAELKFTWQANIGTVDASPTDKAVFVVYNELRELFIQDIGNATRADLTYDLTLPLDFSGETVQVYMAFLKADDKKVSTSQFIAEIIVV